MAATFMRQVQHGLGTVTGTWALRPHPSQSHHSGMTGPDGAPGPAGASHYGHRWMRPSRGASPAARRARTDREPRVADRRSFGSGDVEARAASSPAPAGHRCPPCHRSGGLPRSLGCGQPGPAPSARPGLVAAGPRGRRRRRHGGSLAALGPEPLGPGGGGRDGHCRPPGKTAEDALGGIARPGPAGEPRQRRPSCDRADRRMGGRHQGVSGARCRPPAADPRCRCSHADLGGVLGGPNSVGRARRGRPAGDRYACQGAAS